MKHETPLWFKIWFGVCAVPAGLAVAGLCVLGQALLKYLEANS